MFLLGAEGVAIHNQVLNYKRALTLLKHLGDSNAPYAFE